MMIDIPFGRTSPQQKTITIEQVSTIGADLHDRRQIPNFCEIES